MNPAVETETDLYQNLRWLIFFRVLFSLLLLGSSVLLHINHKPSPLPPPLIVLYGIIGCIWMLSIAYTFLLDHGILSTKQMAYIQTSIDTLFVSAIVVLTGSFFSFFSFLYLVVIIYTSILLYRPGSLLIASVCSLEYGAVFAVDYFGVLTSLGMDSFFMEPIYGWMFLLFKIPITIVAFFAVAFLSSVLAEQAQGTKKELLAMEEHIKRVEKMAAVGEMAAGLAHEIKNPLASIMGSIHLINENQRYDPDQEHLAGIILREADRLTALVNNFLLFAKPPSISAKVIKIEQAVAEVVELFENDPSIQDRVEIIQNCHSTASTHMDPDHFRQILSNLLLNAAEAIKGYGKITIQTHLTPNRPIRLSIADTGCGIPPVNLKTIFNPFFTTKPKGTGLGLSIVHRILDAYHLRLNVDSQIHSGTTVSLLFEPIESSTNS